MRQDRHPRAGSSQSPRAGSGSVGCPGGGVRLSIGEARPLVEPAPDSRHRTAGEVILISQKAEAERLFAGLGTGIIDEGHGIKPADMLGSRTSCMLFSGRPRRALLAHDGPDVCPQPGAAVVRFRWRRQLAW